MALETDFDHRGKPKSKGKSKGKKKSGGREIERRSNPTSLSHNNRAGCVEHHTHPGG
jgi:hypothetical protein